MATPWGFESPLSHHVAVDILLFAAAFLKSRFTFLSRFLSKSNPFLDL